MCIYILMQVIHHWENMIILVCTLKSHISNVKWKIRERKWEDISCDNLLEIHIYIRMISFMLYHKIYLYFPLTPLCGIRVLPSSSWVPSSRHLTKLLVLNSKCHLMWGIYLSLFSSFELNVSLFLKFPGFDPNTSLLGLQVSTLTLSS